MSDTITLIGNIATPPERKITATGLVITSFRLATNDRRFDKRTESWIDGEPNYFSVSAFRALAENAFYSLHKGERAIVTGRLRLKEWETATSKGWAAEIEADSLGPDLQFGTTRFEKNRKPAEPAQDEQRDDWAVAAIRADQPETAASDAETSTEEELVLSGAETPF